MTELASRPIEAIKTRVVDVDVNIDYGQFFGDQHDPHRAKLATESLWRKVTHGQTVKAEHSNPLGHKAVESYDVPATWAIYSTLDNLQGNFLVEGKTVSESVKVDGHHEPIEMSSSLTITPVKKDGRRLVAEKAQDGQTHKRAIWWVSEEQAQSWMKAELKHDEMERQKKR